MLLRILKKDLKRKKTMNVILLLFVILASMFVASGLSNVVTVSNGLDFFMDKANLGTYIIFTQGLDQEHKLENTLNENSAISSYRLERAVYCAQESFEVQGKNLEITGMTMLIPSDDDGINYFDEKNNVIEKVEPGHVYIKKTLLDRSHLQISDVLTVKLGSTKKEFIIEGVFKDAPFGSEILGNERFMLSNTDFDQFFNDEDVNELSKGKAVYIDAESEKAVADSISDMDHIMFGGGRSLLKLAYIMSFIIAFIVLVLSAALIIVAFVVLRFVINLSVTEDFREIGVMKAIGIKNGKIRGIYLIMYLAIAVTGTVIGGILSFPFGKMLILSVSENMVLGNDNDVLFHVIGLLIVVTMTGAFAWGCTRKIKKMSPVDAIRNGNNGERFKKKRSRSMRLKSHTERFLALNDICSKPKRYLSVVLSIMICTLLVLTIVNTSNTLKSDSFAPTFGVTGDLYAGSLDVLTKLQMEGKEAKTEYIRDKEEKLASAGMPCKIMQNMSFSYPVEFEGHRYMLNFMQGIFTTPDDYLYTSGLAPAGKNEVAITSLITETTGLTVGDTFIMKYDDHDEKYLVTATFQTMNNAGNMILVHQDAQMDYSHMASQNDFVIRFTDAPNRETVESRKGKVAELFSVKEKDVKNKSEFCIKTMGAADTMVAVQNLLLLITLVVVILVTVLMERSFVADEKTDIALLKAVGFNNGSIVKWHMTRFFICSFSAVLAAALLSVPVTHIAITPIFKAMGLKTVDYRYDPFMTVLYSAVICGFTVLVSFLISQCTRSVKASDTAGIE